MRSQLRNHKAAPQNSPRYSRVSRRSPQRVPPGNSPISVRLPAERCRCRRRELLCIIYVVHRKLTTRAAFRFQLRHPRAILQYLVCLCRSRARRIPALGHVELHATLCDKYPAVDAGGQTMGTGGHDDQVVHS